MAILSNHLMLVAVLSFIAAMLLFEALYLFWRGRWGAEALRMQERLRSASGTTVGTDAQFYKDRPGDDDSLFQKMALAVPHAEGLQLLIFQSGVQWSLGHLLLLTVASVGVMMSIALVLLHLPTLMVVAAGAAGAAVPALYVAGRRSQRMRKLEQQLPEALDLMTRGLRAGHAFPSTLQMAGEELAEPLAAELRATHDEINYGKSMQEALTHLSERVPSMDVRYFVVAVLIQRESGGNLTEILANLSRLIRERLKLMAKVRVLSAEGRLSAWILIVMPFALGALMSIFNPDFMRPLWTDPMGTQMMRFMLGLMLLGIVALRYIIRIRF
jgi:tight adherence protein B